MKHSSFVLLGLFTLAPTLLAGCPRDISCGPFFVAEGETCACPPGTTYEMTPTRGCRVPDGGLVTFDDAGPVDATVLRDAPMDAPGDAGVDAFVASDACVAQMYYRDGDGDGHGDISTPQPGCTAPEGYVVDSDDCDDLCAECYPGAPETCDTRDNDCDRMVDGAACITLPTDNWTGRTAGAFAAVDGAGNIYSAGHYTGSLAIVGGPTVGSSSTASDIFLVSYAEDGSFRWAESFGGIYSDMATGMAVDADGNVYLIGQFADTVSFGGSPLVDAGSGDVFVASFTSTGVHRWSFRFGTNRTEHRFAIAVDPAGDVYIAGALTVALNVGGSDLASDARGSTNLVLAAFSRTDGAHQWSRRFGGVDSSEAGDSIAYHDGTIVVGGPCSGRAELGGPTLVAPRVGAAYAFIAGYTTSGAHRWSHAFGSELETTVRHVAATSTGDWFGAGRVTYGGYQNDGTLLWSQVLSGTGRPSLTGLVVDDADQVVFAGDFANGNVDVSGRVFTSVPPAGFMASVTPSGGLRWATQMQQVSVLAAGRSGRVIASRGGTLASVRTR